MSFPAKGLTKDTNFVIYNPAKDGDNVDITCEGIGHVLINGVLPSGGGGGGGGPYDGPGDIRLNTGTFTAVGDGVTTGRVIGQSMTSTDNITITSGNLEVTTGGIDIKGNGDLDLEGNGNISLLGTGNIGVGTGGVTSVGDIETSSGDIISAGNFIFEGNDLYHRTNTPVVGALTSYVTYKQLPQLNAANTFTGANKFNDNVTEFADKVSVGTRDVNGLFTQNIALNSSGNIECQTIQNVTSIQTGTLNCGNGGTNSCAARTFTTRTSGLAGWNIEQQLASVPADPYDNVLNFKAGQAGGFVTITDSVGSFAPNIVLDPKTPAIGGLIKTTTFEVGDGGLAYKLTQPVTGPDTDNLLIKSSSAVGEAIFQDELDASIMTVKKTEVQLGNTIPLSFGAYSFRPQQFYKDITNFSFNHALVGPTNLLFNTGNPAVQEWTNVNTGATNQPIDLINNPGAYKLTIRQLTAGSQNEINGMFIMSDIVLSRPNDNAPDVELPQPTAYSFEKYDGIEPVITMIPGFLTWGVHITFLQVSQNETANIRVTLTQMPYFA